MAKLTVELDTKSGELAVVVDGNAIGGESVADISVYNWGSKQRPEWRFSVSTAEEVGDVTKIVRLCASESPQAKAAEKSIASTIDGYVLVESSKTQSTDYLTNLFKRG